MLEHRLLKLDVSRYTEKKQNLTYLSWSHAWAQALNIDPTANFNVAIFDNKPYVEINGTAMVWVNVTMEGRTRTCWLPVMNAQNKPISFEGRTYKDRNGNTQHEKIDAFNVNTAIMRCLVKCLGMFGLGLNIYAGEDLPLSLEDDEPPKEEKKEEKVEKPKAKAKEEVKETKPAELTEQEKDNLILFADSMVQYLEIQRTVSDLNGYWKANQITVDELKVKLPDTYSYVVGKFKEAKEKINGKPTEDASKQ